MTASTLIFYMVIAATAVLETDSRMSGTNCAVSGSSTSNDLVAYSESPDSSGSLPVMEVVAKKNRSEYGYYGADYQYLARVLVRHAFYLLVGSAIIIIGVIALNKGINYIHHSHMRKESLTVPLHQLLQRKSGSVPLKRGNRQHINRHRQYPYVH